MSRPYRTSYTLAEVKAMLARLGPRGPLWQSSGVLAMLEGLAGEWRRIMERVGVALSEYRGGTASETLPEWLAEYGLDADPCTPVPADEADQQVLVAGAVAAVGGQAASYYASIATAMGISPVTIEEGPTGPYPPPECGVAECGDELTGDRAVFVWRITAPAATSAEARAALECRINRAKPAHTLVEYVYA